MVTAPKLPPKMSSRGQVRVVHGCHDDGFPVAGYTVDVVRTSLRYVFNDAADAKSLVNGFEVDRSYRLADGDLVEFVRSWGRKGGLPVNRYGDIGCEQRYARGAVPHQIVPPDRKAKANHPEPQFTTITAPSG